MPASFSDNGSKTITYIFLDKVDRSSIERKPVRDILTVLSSLGSHHMTGPKPHLEVLVYAFYSVVQQKYGCALSESI